MAGARATTVRPPVQATGRVVRDREGLELLVERRISATAGDVWEWLTASGRLKKWIGGWKGTAEVGADIQFTIDGTTRVVTVLACEPQKRLALRWDGDALRVSLAHLDGSTVIYLAQRIGSPREAGAMGPMWEYYLDRLIAARSGASMPELGDYMPSQRPYFERLATDGDPEAWRGR